MIQRPPGLEGPKQLVHATAYKPGEGVGYFCEGWNSYQTHPLQAQFADKPARIYMHAEIDLLSKLVSYAHVVSREQFEKVTMQVARYRRDGSLAMAKPCAGCERALIAFGVGHVWYTNEKGEWQKLW